MSRFENLGIRDGVWRGRLTAGAPPQRLVVTLNGRPVSEASVTAADKDWDIAAPLPAAAIQDGIQTFLLVETRQGADAEAISGQSLGQVSVIAGQPLDQDLVAEIATLRAELDLVKRELRRLADGQF
ncbi:hypothetical protein [Paracoccus pacificus]|uniref:Uncharacterized protein n=1 Tax=Paracoccus pacificus TaxID=1463598 RepID=A0ABW4R285_9RHOB